MKFDDFGCYIWVGGFILEVLKPDSLWFPVQESLYQMAIWEKDQGAQSR